MQNTALLIVTKNGLHPDTQDCVDALECPSVIKLRGMSNLPKARSIGFDQVLTATLDTPIDTVLCLDDDMVFSKLDIDRLVAISRKRGEPVSAAALTQTGVLAARPHNTIVERPHDRRRWLTGLACMAIPVALLRSTAVGVPMIGNTRAWCLTGEHPQYPGEWFGEDFWFCLHFNGVELAPIAIGHMKSLSIKPDEATLRQL